MFKVLQKVTRAIPAIKALLGQLEIQGHKDPKATREIKALPELLEQKVTRVTKAIPAIKAQLALRAHKVTLGQKDQLAPQDPAAQTEHREQQDLVVKQAHKALQDPLAHKEHQERKVTRVIQAHRVFQ
jgi:hypothetical protein